MDMNVVVLIGRLASEPELKYTPSGIPVTQFRLAVNRPMSAEARQSGQEKQADFITIVAWRQSAEYAGNYLGKGRLVAVEGRLQIREYETKDGQKRRDAEIVANSLKSLDRPKEGDTEGGSGGYGGGGGYQNNGYSQPQEREEYAAPAPQPRAAERPAPAPARRPAAPPPSSGGSRYQPAAAGDDLDDPFADE